MGRTYCGVWWGPRWVNEKPDSTNPRQRSKTVEGALRLELTLV